MGKAELLGTFGSVESVVMSRRGTSPHGRLLCVLLPPRPSARLSGFSLATPKPQNPETPLADFVFLGTSHMVLVSMQAPT